MADFLDFFRSEVVGDRGAPGASTQQQVEALNRVSLLCKVLGPSKTRQLLIPLFLDLQQQVKDRDELLCLFAVQWRTVASTAAADDTATAHEKQVALAQCADALAVLAAAEEKCIRHEAVASLLSLPSLLSPPHRKAFVQQRLLPISKALAANEACLFARCAAARLLPHLLCHSEPRSPAESLPREGDMSPEKQHPPQKDARAAPSGAEMYREFDDAADAAESLTTKRIEQLFEALCADESLLVRREALQQLPALVEGSRAARIASATATTAGSSADTATAPAEDEAQLVALRILREAFGETSDYLRAAAAESVVALATSYPPPTSCLVGLTPSASPRGPHLQPSCDLPVTSTPPAGERESNGVFSVGELLSLYLRSASDPSWRVRSVAAKELYSIVSFSPLNFGEIYPSLCLLLQDSAVREVRLAAISSLAKITQVLPQEETTQKLLPLVQQLLQGALLSAKPPAADSWDTLGPAPPLFPPPPSHAASIAAAIDAALAVWQAAESVAAVSISREVFMTLQQGDLVTAVCIAKRLNDFCRLYQPKASSSGGAPAAEAAQLVEALCEFRRGVGQTGDWRLRLEIVKQMPAVAQTLGVKFFISSLSPFLFDSFCDPIHQVREAAVDACEELIPAVGYRWAVESLLPRLVRSFEGCVPSQDSRGALQDFGGSQGLHGDANTTASPYLRRIVVQHTLPKLAAALPLDISVKHVVPLLLEGLQDAVPNVRLTAAEMLRIIAKQKTLPPQTLADPLEVLSADEDVDVRFSAKLALAACRAASAA
ncbi:serine/threonine-protein phosphatase 2A 65 kDa regulatory subunit A beta isoform [Cyclospora cayetanensis]|uniref:Serine/threonine-protein phosphatase 2A 65 kDa regulatory subunit A beta isoform n=1 Tax=Cyclospora cayetanensis TaxID=88456 RepID=A0A6P6RU67_9EIME|nr:serine/threonine-protein phosphatase 2A 65 kDa regulatory subunit A beta isoform [Cyclospora cayetanensis]